MRVLSRVVSYRPIHKRAVGWKFLGHVVDDLLLGGHIMRKFIAAIGELCEMLNDIVL